ncbi:hypothetical protein [Kitasatospora viridis]|uniref:DUF1772 domain-containing protein n=1 Tax=Kitasatospora viridis TaxID=281105 RepID=A0A561UCH5_9ACTN|nr:hypothetical protein [Kitasatospora viridis]TWF97056.1 hypothetical protein FHX73_11831 [Kitasatospora viridis]
MGTHILIVWVLAAAGIQLGTLWIMKLSILPMLNSLPYSRYVDVCQLIDMHVFHPIAVWNGVIAAGIGAYLAFTAGGGAAVAVLFLLGSVGMTIVGLASEGFNRPIWRQIEKWDPRLTATDWAEKRYRWHVAHQVRTYGAIGAVGAYAAAAIVLAA